MIPVELPNDNKVEKDSTPTFIEDMAEQQTGPSMIQKNFVLKKAKIFIPQSIIEVKMK